MSDSEITDAQLADWVEQSFWLDLAYDEEDPTLAREHVGDLASEDVQGLLDREAQISGVLSLAALKKKHADLTVPDAAVWFRIFLKLKAIRVQDGLALDRVAFEFAEQEEEKNDRALGLLTELKKSLEARRENLEVLTWRCGAALDFMLPEYRGAKADEDVQQGDSNHSAPRRDWATLIALFHSEFCASASHELSFGAAQRFHVIVPKNAVGYEVFRRVATHNVARGYSHLGMPLDVVRTIDPLVDQFRLDLSDQILGKEFPSLNLDQTRQLVYRLLFFPAALTLGLALEDLNRHAEQGYYLKTGLDAAQNYGAPCSYWSRLLKLHRALLLVDTGREATEIPSEHFIGPPRMSRAWRVANATANARSLSGPESNGAGSPTMHDWSRHNSWLLRWHAAEKHKLLPSVAKTAGTLGMVVEGQPDDNEDGKRAAQQEAQETLSRVLEYLDSWEVGGIPTPKTPFPEDPPDRERSVLWTATLDIYKILVAALADNRADARNDPDLETWRAVLKEYLRSKSEVFRQFRTEAEAVDLTLDDELRKRESCAAIPPAPQEPTNSGSTPVHERSAEGGGFPGCGDYGCAELAVHSKVNGTVPPLASLGYYFSVMSEQQERFLTYLRDRTARRRSYCLGEQVRPSAEFEFISLRRWNSFSPNLGSRASTSVGGGYLVRVWEETAKRYVGIAVDPGYDFLENLFNEGFALPDIDLVMVTHAHPDHTENLTNLFTLLRERHKRMRSAGQGCRRTPREHRVLLAMTEGVFGRYQSHFAAEQDFIKDIAVLASRDGRGSKASCQTLGLCVDTRTHDSPCHMVLGDRAQLSESPVAVRATRAWHRDGTEHDTVGVEVALRNDDAAGRIGILSDSRYNPALHEEYLRCSVLIVHLGGLLNTKQYKGFHSESAGMDFETWLAHLSLGCARKPKDDHPGGPCSRYHLYELLKSESHLYLPGLAWLICDLCQRKRASSPPLIVLSEFGEELRGGLRADLARRLSLTFQEYGLQIIPGDVGLRIDVENKTIFCSVCHRYVDPSQIRAETVLPGEEAIAYVCSDCRATRGAELPKLLEEWCTTGRPVVPLEEPSGEL